MGHGGKSVSVLWVFEYFSSLQIFVYNLSKKWEKKKIPTVFLSFIGKNKDINGKKHMHQTEMKIVLTKKKNPTPKTQKRKRKEKKGIILI